MALFDNLSLLKEDLEKNGWILEAFNFNYKGNNYVVLAKLYLKGEEKPKYALLKTEFIRADDFNKSLTLSVNSKGFIDIDVKLLRLFFNIEYSRNLGEIIKQFAEYFSSFIPNQINFNKSKLQKQCVIFSLSKSDNQDPNKIYCFTVKRNPGNQYRTSFNDNKTRILRPNLYLKFKEEPTISFCYSLEKSDEKNDEEIIEKFANRND
ncbi:DUF6037 family protein [Flavobacterium piscisymbiosum]|uniref:DUF6037 family protein n=1 Tax=Flavobacterium piscisymbiosum TaxID=2893753 RepID=A0ABS8M9H7_9FLAO|nr:DUF6037 family protein [Flavobacterium sp. F-30]MCC9062089.1 DUF6037 family protein [Flavobacterium sp. F-30]